VPASGSDSAHTAYVWGQLLERKEPVRDGSGWRTAKHASVEANPIELRGSGEGDLFQARQLKPVTYLRTVVWSRASSGPDDKPATGYESRHDVDDCAHSFLFLLPRSWQPARLAARRCRRLSCPSPVDDRLGAGSRPFVSSEDIRD
jgi:hypothetical protein